MEAKEKAAALYKKDYKKWRDYKRQIYEEVVRDQKKGHRSTRSSTKPKKLGSPSMDRREKNTKPICMYSPCVLCVLLIDLSGVGINTHPNHDPKQTRPRATNEADKENYIVTPTTGRQGIHPANPSLSADRVFPSHSSALHHTSPSCIQPTAVHPEFVLPQPNQDVDAPLR
jgi:hypothetical protein